MNMRVIITLESLAEVLRELKMNLSFLFQTLFPWTLCLSGQDWAPNLAASRIIIRESDFIGLPDYSWQAFNCGGRVWKRSKHCFIRRTRWLNGNELSENLRCHRSECMRIFDSTYLDQSNWDIIGCRLKERGQEGQEETRKNWRKSK